VLLHDESHVAGNAADPHSPWARADAWRVGHAGKRIVALAWRDQRFEIEARRVPLHVDAAHVLLHDAHGQRYSLGRAAAFAWKAKDTAGGNQVIAPMPG